jgi:hypothetical protein
VRVERDPADPIPQRVSLVTASGISSAGGTKGADHTLPIFVLAGDADHDRDVDVNDLGILASNWQQSPRTFSEGDFDHSGTVDVNDLGILASQWQQTLAPASAPLASIGQKPAVPSASRRMCCRYLRPELVTDATTAARVYACYRVNRVGFEPRITRFGVSPPLTFGY